MSAWFTAEHRSHGEKGFNRKMALKQASYKGDHEYYIDCMGDVVAGDEIRFERAVIRGKIRSKVKGRFCNSVIVGFELVTGKVTSEGYKQSNERHTFSIQRSDGSKIKIKGGTLHANGVWRKPWENEGLRLIEIQEKRKRKQITHMAKIEKERGKCLSVKAKKKRKSTTIPTLEGITAEGNVLYVPIGELIDALACAPNILLPTDIDN
jgi:hypothetical protein